MGTDWMCFDFVHLAVLLKRFHVGVCVCVCVGVCVREGGDGGG